MIIDGLQCGNFNRDTFEGLQRAGVLGVVNTTGFWEGTVESMDRLGEWRDLVAANSDLCEIATTADQIRTIAASGRVAVIIGFQNANLFEGRVRLVEMWAELGARVVQLTYNNQNDLAGSCYETEDSGLARYGREIIKEMNAAGILVDCSHVGNRSTLMAIEASSKPIAVTHANADSLFPHKRNKTDDVLRALRDTGGVIGCATYRNITGDHYCKTIENWAEMVARTVDIAGIDSVAIGTDRGQNLTAGDYAWMRKGRWTRGADYGAGSATNAGKALPPDWFQKLEDMAVIPGGLKAVGFNEEEIAKITHQNWLRLYAETFRA